MKLQSHRERGLRIVVGLDQPIVRMRHGPKARRQLEQDRRQAMVDGEFEIHYQPLVNLQSDEVTQCR